MKLFGATPHKIQLSTVWSFLVLLLASCDRNSTTPTLPANINLKASEGIIPKMSQARYALIPVNNGAASSTPYVIDSQTGRVWRESLDLEHNTVVFVSVIYKNVNGDISTVPNETETGVVFKDAPQLRPPTDNASNFSITVAFTNYPDKALLFWKTQLELCKQGHFVIQLNGFDEKGEPVFGQTIPASDEVANQLRLDIANCQKVIEDREHLVKQLLNRPHP
jgi:hypothetical protein